LFDIAFSELIIVAIVALIVIGPEKLPKVARTLGTLAGRMQRYIATVKQDVERELKLDDLQKLRHDIQQGSQTLRHEVENTIHSAESEMNQALEDAANPPREPESLSPGLGRGENEQR
jgi:sec-independent protein translocase protein TatB